MKKVIGNSVLSILFTLTIVFSSISLTLCNDNFINKYLDKYHYSYIAYKEICKELDKIGLEGKYTLSEKEVKEDIQLFVKSKYNLNTIEKRIHIDDKIIIEESIIQDIYQDKINFLKIKRDDIKNIIYIIYLITLSLIVVTGSLFIKTKKGHSLKFIFSLSFLLLVSIYGIMYFNINDTTIFNKILINYNHVILGIGIILLEVAGYMIYKEKRRK